MSIQPKPVQGLRVPLFDRLVDSAPEVRKELTPLRIYGRAALFASIARDLGRLLNARRTAIFLEDRLTVLDYGIPDFTYMSAADQFAHQSLAETIRVAIEAFEPRLQGVVIRFERDPRNPRVLAGSISGQLRVGTYTEPVTFSIVHHGSHGEMEVLAPGTEGAPDPGPAGVIHG